MLASKTSHKRRRSSARGDASRASVSDSRSIVTVAGSVKGKERQTENDSWAWKRLEKTVASHAINHCLQVSVPVASEEETSALMGLLPGPSRAYLVKIPLCLFLDPIFILSHIKRGQLVALSKGRLDADDVICLDGSGVLHLSLTRDSYQTLGLVGQVLKQSRTSSGKGRDRLSGKYERWMVRIDLLAASFVPGKPNFDRTLARLREWDQRRSDASSKDHSSWDMLFCWTDTDLIVGSEMHFPPRYVAQNKIVKIDIRPSVSITEDCWVPKHSQAWEKGWRSDAMQMDHMDWDSWHEQLEGLLEWNGLAAMSADCIRTFARSDHLNSYQVGSDDSRRAASVVKIQYRGLLSSEFCTSVLKSVQSYILSKDSNAFAVISCSGFTDSPIAWKMDSQLTPDAKEDAMQEESSSDGDNFEENVDALYDDDVWKATGPKARQIRQKKRAKRGYISRHQTGYQVKLPGSSNCNGWNVIFFNKGQEQNGQADYVCIENVGGCLKC